MVKDSLDAINVVFDDDRSVADAGVLVAATLARRLGIEALVNECVDLGRRVGYFRPGRKVMSLVHAKTRGLTTQLHTSAWKGVVTRLDSAALLPLLTRWRLGRLN